MTARCRALVDAILGEGRCSQAVVRALCLGVFLITASIANDTKAAPPPIGADIVLPSNKEGVSDPGYFGPQPSDAALAARYQVFTKQMQVGIRIYNIFWSGLEDSGVVSAPKPINCNPGYTLVPRNEQERVAEGYHRFRYIKQNVFDRFDKYLGLDARYGIQSAVVLWSAPEIYRYPDCTGAAWGGRVMKDGCVPRDDATDDFEDYVNFLAARYNGGGYGKISHYVVWNENGSPTWFDYSPIIRAHITKNEDVSDPNIGRVVTKYAVLVKTAYTAITRHARSMMLYVSTDQVWDAPVQRGHFSSKILLEKLWDNLGTSIKWSVAVHPSGYLLANNPHAYTFRTLSMVEEFQVEQLRRRGVTPQGR